MYFEVELPRTSGLPNTSMFVSKVTTRGNTLCTGVYNAYHTIQWNLVTLGDKILAIIQRCPLLRGCFVLGT